MKNRRRFKTEQQILSAIDRAHERMAEYGRLFSAAKNEAAEVRYGRNINRIENCVLPHLGRKLSEFRTETFRFTNDRSVPI